MRRLIPIGLIAVLVLVALLADPCSDPLREAPRSPGGPSDKGQRALPDPDPAPDAPDGSPPARCSALSRWAVTHPLDADLDALRNSGYVHEDGRFEMRLQPGRHIVSVYERESRRTAEAEIEILDGRVTSHEFRLSQK